MRVYANFLVDFESLIIKIANGIQAYLRLFKTISRLLRLMRKHILFS